MYEPGINSSPNGPVNLPYQFDLNPNKSSPKPLFEEQLKNCYVVSMHIKTIIRKIRKIVLYKNLLLLQNIKYAKKGINKNLIKIAAS